MIKDQGELKSTKLVSVRVDGDTAFIELDDSSNRNAVSRTMHHELSGVIAKVARRADIRFMVLTGHGRTFSSGGDLKELAAGLPANYVTDYWQRMSGTVLAIRNMPQVVVAGVQGYAIGAGAALALACDIVVAESNSKMRFSFTHLGLLPDAGTTVMLPRLMGPAIARDLLTTGRWIGAVEACSRGMLARVCEPGTLNIALEGLLTELRQSPKGALGMVKNLMEASSLADYTAGVRAEGVQQFAAAASGEYREYLARALERTTSKGLPEEPSGEPIFQNHQTTLVP